MEREVLRVPRCLSSTFWARWGVICVAAFFISPAAAVAADAVSLHVGPNPVQYGGRVVFSGAIAPAVGGETVGIYTQDGSDWRLVASRTTAADGTFAYRATVRIHRVFLARTADALGNSIDSARVSVVVRPRLVTALRGLRRIGERLYLTGNIRPRAAGAVILTEGGRARRLSVGPNGHFEARLTTTRVYRYRAIVRLRPAVGYVARHRKHSIDVKLRLLAIGARGPTVWWLEYSLFRLHHYALPRVDNVYDSSTSDAVLAFQKVHDLPRTASVDVRFWRVLRTSGPPPARVPSGDHIEVDKTRQVLFEVRQGKVVSVSHISTGATGNTPLGHWHVYSKGPGFNAKGMYDSLFFVGNFAIHGYYSVPSYPASHGCVRTPLWFAGAFYARWSVGASVYVFP